MDLVSSFDAATYPRGPSNAPGRKRARTNILHGNDSIVELALHHLQVASTIARTPLLSAGRALVSICLGFVRPSLYFDLHSEIRSAPNTCMETLRSRDLRSIALTSTIARTCPTRFRRTLVSICLRFLVFGFGFGKDFGLATEILVVIHSLGMLDV